MSKNTSLISFLDLPAELRLKVYAHCADLEAAPFSEFKGLYLSCNQIKNEMDAECGKIMGKYVESIGLPGLTGTFRDLRNPIIHPIHYHRIDDLIKFSVRKFWESRHLHLDSITLQYKYVPDMTLTWSCNTVMECFEDDFADSTFPNAQKVIICFNAEDEVIDINHLTVGGEMHVIEYKDGCTIEWLSPYPVLFVLKEASLPQKAIEEQLDSDFEPTLTIQKRLGQTLPEWAVRACSGLEASCGKMIDSPPSTNGYPLAA